MPTSHHVATLLCAGTLLACSAEPTPDRVLAPHLNLSEIPMNAAGPSASGHADVIQQPSGAKRTFSFHGRRMPDGTVQGEYDNHNRQQGFVNHGDVDCLRFVGTNVAVMSGTVLRSTNPAAPAGGRAIFTVEDNGEGADDTPDTPDRVSMLFNFPAGSTVDCMTFTPIANLSIIGGNIRVDP
jgi:hypothetical protein